MFKLRPHDIFGFDESHGGSRIQSLLNRISNEYSGELTMLRLEAYCKTNNIKLSEAEIEYLEGFFARRNGNIERFVSDEDALSL